MVIQKSFVKEHFLADIARFTKGRVSRLQMDPHINCGGGHFFKTDSTSYVFATRVFFNGMGGSAHFAYSLVVGHLLFGCEIVDTAVATWILDHPIMPLVQVVFVGSPCGERDIRTESTLSILVKRAFSLVVCSKAK